MPYEASSASIRVRTLGPGLTTQSYHSSLRVMLVVTPATRVRGVAHEDPARPHTGVLRVTFGDGADEAGVERVDVVLALTDGPAGVVHAHEAAAAADVGLECGALRRVEQDAAGLREDHRVTDGEVRGRERRRVVGLLDVDRLAVLGAELGRQVTHSLPGLHVGGVEIGLVEQQHAEPAVVGGGRQGRGGKRGGGCRSGDQRQCGEPSGSPSGQTAKQSIEMNR
ncbi:hypothetical protein GCM10027610_084090 [Dactylosporangium cerinum]